MEKWFVELCCLHLSISLLLSLIPSPLLCLLDLEVCAWFQPKLGTRSEVSKTHIAACVTKANIWKEKKH